MNPTHSEPFVFLPFSEGTICGRLIERRKRFLVKIQKGTQDFWIHTNNTGSMLGLLRQGLPVLASKSNNPLRKLPFTLEAVKVDETAPSGGFWAGVNTSVPNRMLEAAFASGALPVEDGYTSIRREVRNGASRLDAVITGSGVPPCWIECKNVTLVEDETALFPDAVTERGAKHLRELMAIAQRGERAAMFYLVQRPDARCFAPADCIDPAYAEEFLRAVESGVEIFVFQADVSPEGIQLARRLPVADRFVY